MIVAGLRRAGVLIAATLVAALPAAPAAADSDPLAISFDGIAFSTHPATPLFQTAGTVIPGSVRSERVWFRNTGTDAGLLTVVARDIAASDPDLLASVTLRLQPTSGPVTQPAALDPGTGCVVLSAPLALAPGATAAADIVLTVDPRLGERPGDSGLDAVRATTTFRVDAVLTDADAGPVDDAICRDELPEGGSPSPGPAPSTAPSRPVSVPVAPAPAAGSLTMTGGPLAIAGAVAGVALAASAILLAARRRGRTHG